MINLTSAFGEGPTRDETPVQKDPLFGIGQLVRHRRYGYRGVIVEFDAVFSGSEAWYLKNKTQPPKNQPWYHVLVDESIVATYAAQTSLTADDSGLAVRNSLVEVFFKSFKDGRYVRNDVPWKD